MRNFNDYTSRIAYVLSKQLQLSWRLAMMISAFILLFSTNADAQKTKETFGVSFSQYANEPTKEQWINGALIPNNSQYYEGTSTLQRIVLVNIKATPGNTHELLFKVLSTKGGINAYDFVTGFDQALKDYMNITGSEITNSTFDMYNDAERLRLVAGASIPNPATAAMITSLFRDGTSAVAAVPAASTYLTKQSILEGYDNDNYPAFNGKDKDTKRGVQLYGVSGNPITGAVLEFIGYSAPDLFGDSYGEYRLTWVSASPNILILMGGHLSTSDNSSPYPALWHGPSKGAAFISGGPYHFKLETLNGISLGNQDNQIQSGAIEVFPAGCILPAAGPFCAGTTNSHTASSEGVPDATYDWKLDPANGATFVGGGTTKQTVATGGATSSSVSVIAGTGTYTLTVTVSKTGYISKTCSTQVAVNGNPTITGPAIGAVCQGATTASFSYTGVTNGANQYKIVWDAAAVTAGLTSMSDFAALPSSPFNLTIPGTLAATTYNGTIYVRNSTTTCESAGTAISLTVNENPAINTPAIGAICAGTTSASLTYASVTGGANQYRIDWNADANTAGLVDVAYTSLPASPITISGTGSLSAGTYSGTIYVKNTNTTCESAGAAISLVVNGNPTALAGGDQELCQASSGTTRFTVKGTYTNGTPQWSETSANATIVSQAAGTGDDAGKWVAIVDIVGSNSVVMTLTTTSNATPSCVSATDDLTLTVNANPNAPAAEYLPPACDETEFKVKVNSPSGNEVIAGATYTLMTGDRTVVTTFTPASSAAFTFTSSIAAGAGFIVSVETVESCRSGEYACPAPAATLNTSSTKTLQTSDKIQKDDEVTAYPVPFYDRTTIEFKSERNGKYVINLYDMKGKLVRELKSGTVKAGETKSIEVDGRDLAEGMYLARIVSDAGSKTVKLLKRK
ncbi:T9SS type A sorting domain-containing protein [Pontibacter populi]|uniref:T9SS type A sorting domain-containing protein n=1 Tax=Pontibacter populi TaxID=890055 RepID=A0ABV1RQ72_9BACT